MRIRCSSAYLRRVALPLAGTPPFRRYGIVLEEAKGEPRGTGRREGKERKKKTKNKNLPSALRTCLPPLGICPVHSMERARHACAVSAAFSP